MNPLEPVPTRQQAERPRVVGIDLPMGTDPASVRQRIEAMERLLEGMFEVPVVGRVGLDSIVGFVPVSRWTMVWALLVVLRPTMVKFEIFGCEM